MAASTRSKWSRRPRNWDGSRAHHTMPSLSRPAPPRLPMELIGQLVPGGRLVVPVGSRENQELMKVTRTDDSYSVWTMGGCRFVPLIGKGAWPDLVAALVIK